MELLRKVELLAPQLSREHLLLAGQRVLKLADRCAAEQRADQLDDSPLLPNHLSLDQCGVHALDGVGLGNSPSWRPNPSLLKQNHNDTLRYF